MTAVNMLQDKTVLVTGAAGGLGRAIAECAIAAGARGVVLADRDERSLAAAAQEIDAANAELSTCFLDVTSESSWATAMAHVQDAHGGLDVLVNNAGITDRAGVLDVDLESWHRVIAVNQTGVLLGMRAAAPLLSAEGGSIVNIGSFAAHTGYKAVAYTASKWALRGMTQVAATELSAHGIRVNSVSPGFVATPLTANAGALVAAFSEATPIGRPCRPGEIAQAVVFLASEAASYITGTDMLVDGGYQASTSRFVT